MILKATLNFVNINYLLKMLVRVKLMFSFRYQIRMYGNFLEIKRTRGQNVLLSKYYFILFLNMRTRNHVIKRTFYGTNYTLNLKQA